MSQTSSRSASGPRSALVFEGFSSVGKFSHRYIDSLQLFTATKPLYMAALMMEIVPLT